MFHLVFVIVIVLPFVRSSTICPSTKYCECSYSPKKTVLTFKCNRGLLTVKVFQKERLQISCSENITNNYDFLPTLNQSFFLNEYRYQASCPIPEDFSVITNKFPSPSFVEFVHINLKILSANFFDQEYPILYLYLSRNRMKSLDENVFRNLTKLQWIDLSRNQFKTLPVNLFKYNVNLIHFVLNGNEKKCIKLSDGFLANKMHLNTFTMMNNSNFELTPGVLANCPRLQEINLNECNLKTFNG